MGKTRKTPVRSLAKIAHRLCEGDVLLFRKTGKIEDEAISVAGHSDLIHAGMIGMDCRRNPMCLETLQWVGGQVNDLYEYVAEYPGQLLVKKIAPEFRKKYNRTDAVAKMLEIVGKPYGWWALCKASLIHIPFVRWFVKPSTDDNENGDMPYCSMAVARAMRAGGVDPVRKLADSWTQPGDLDRSATLVDYCWLIP